MLCRIRYQAKVPRMTIRLGVALALIAGVVSLSCHSQNQGEGPAPVPEPASNGQAASSKPAPPVSVEGLPGRPVAKPVAQSEMTERQSEQFLAAPSQASPGGQQSAGASARDTLSPVLAEIPGVSIGWFVNRSIDAFRVAINRNQPLVLVLGEDWCRYCTQLIHDSLRCPAVDRYAGDATFAYSVPSMDMGASAIASSLQIEAWPTITVLEPEARMLLERGRINGYFDASMLGEHLETILYKAPPRRYEDQPPPLGWFAFVAPLHAQGTPRRPRSVESAAAGAAQRGLKPIRPEPRCR